MIWPFCPLDGMIEGLQFRTNDLRAYSTDQRVSLVHIPRRTFNHNYMWSYEQFERARAMLRETQPGPFELPDWASGQLHVNANSGATTISVDTTVADYYVGGRALITKDCETYEAVTIDGVTANSIDITSPLDNDYTDARVMPMFLAHAPNGLSYQRVANPIVPGQMEWTTYDGSDLADGTGLATYRSKPLLTQAAAVGDGGIDSTVSYPADMFDNGMARPFIDRAQAQPAQTYGSVWQPRTRADVFSLRQFFYYIKGKQKAFWLPDFNRGITLINSIAPADTSILVKRFGFASGYGTGNLFIKLSNGSYYTFQVDSSAVVGPNEQLNLVGTAGATIAINSVRTACLMFLVRLASDRIEFQHRSKVGPRVAVPVEEVPIQ